MLHYPVCHSGHIHLDLGTCVTEGGRFWVNDKPLPPVRQSITSQDAVTDGLSVVAKTVYAAGSQVPGVVGSVGVPAVRRCDYVGATQRRR